jgi:hypothetical protein
MASIALDRFSIWFLTQEKISIIGFGSLIEADWLAVNSTDRIGDESEILKTIASNLVNLNALDFMSLGFKDSNL